MEGTKVGQAPTGIAKKTLTDNVAAASAISNGGIVALSFGAAALGILLGIGGSAVYVKKRQKKA